MTTTANVSHTWWRRLSLGPPDDVNGDHFRALRQRGFSRTESHAALCEAGDSLDAAFHAAIRFRHKSHTGSPFLYDGCDLCDEEKLRYAAKRAGAQSRRESHSGDDDIVARKAEAVEKWRQRYSAALPPPPVELDKTLRSAPTRSLSCNGRQRCIKWCCPQDSQHSAGPTSVRDTDNLGDCRSELE